jgi:hypothetical protein
MGSDKKNREREREKATERGGAMQEVTHTRTNQKEGENKKPRQ